LVEKPAQCPNSHSFNGNHNLYWHSSTSATCSKNEDLRNVKDVSLFDSTVDLASNDFFVTKSATPGQYFMHIKTNVPNSQIGTEYRFTYGNCAATGST